MALHGAAMLLNQGGYSGYQIDQSMVLDGSTDYLSWTPASSADRKTHTHSFFLKLTDVSSSVNHVVTAFGTSFTDTAYLGFRIAQRLGNTNRLIITGGANQFWYSDAMLRDVGSWYHIVIAIDSTESTATDRIKVWINGVQNTGTFNSNIALNADTGFGINAQHRIGGHPGQGWFPGYISDYHAVAEALDATSFGEFYNGTQWRPIQPSGLTYGTNGFYLPFTQDTPNLGVDYSGNGNDWTENGSPVQSSDSPTVNYATLNPLSEVSSNITFSAGNLNGSTGNGSGRWSIGTIAITPGQSVNWYFELAKEGDSSRSLYLGISKQSGLVSGSGNPSTGSIVYRDRGDLVDEGTTSSSWGTSWDTPSTDYGMCAVSSDGTTVKVWFGDANTWRGSGDPAAGTNEAGSLTFDGEPIHLVCIFDGGTGTAAGTVDFGQNGYQGTKPDGFTEISAANLPEATITDPGEHFVAVIYTGDGTAIGSGGNSITGVGFQSDFTWIKNRDATDSHMLFDVIRGATKVLHSNETAAETTESETLTSFDSDGFTLGSDVEVNTNTEDYISWNWKANGAGVANTDGTISSTVSVNDYAGFSIVSYTGTGSAATVGHGLSDAPEMIIFKKRDGTLRNWTVWHHLLANGANGYLGLNSTAAEASDSTVMNSTEPTSSVFSVGTFDGTNGSTVNHIAYCFRSIPGYSKVFSYTGNGSTDGPFVYLGLKPRWIMWKESSHSGSGWGMIDTEREPYNDGSDATLAANSSAAEFSSNYLDALSNGFKIRVSGGWINTSGRSFIGIAFAENPFGGSNVPLALAR